MKNQNPELHQEDAATSKEFFIWFSWNDFMQPKKRKLMMVGVCSRTGRIAKIEDMLYAMVVRSTYIINGRCEQAERCMDLRCDLNRTTWESLCRAAGRQRIPRQPEHFAPGKGLNELEFPEFAEKAREAGHGLFVAPVPQPKQRNRRKKEANEP